MSWRSREATSAWLGYPRSPHRSMLAQAKCACRALDRLDTTRVHRPRNCVRRDTPAPDHVRPLLQRVPHAFGLAKGRTDQPLDRAVGQGHRPPRSRWVASSLRTNLIFGRHRRSGGLRSQGPRSPGSSIHTVLRCRPSTAPLRAARATLNLLPLLL
jgi:hypothetical protein